jgi:hypothetical protein
VNAALALHVRLQRVDREYAEVLDETSEGACDHVVPEGDVIRSPLLPLKIVEIVLR